MARSLAFTADHFETVYAGLLNSQRGFEAPSETRIVVRILDKLEEKAEQFTEGEGSNKITSYRLKDGKGMTVTLTDEEYKLLLEAVKAVKWTGRVVRKVTSTLEWLEAIEST
jgi:hypothetical protein